MKEKTLRDMVNDIGMIAYEQFMYNDELEVKTDLTFNYNNYCEVNFDFEGLHFYWSVNKRGFICQHNPFKFDFSKKIEEDILERTKELMCRNIKKDKEAKIKELEAKLEELREL